MSEHLKLSYIKKSIDGTLSDLYIQDYRLPDGASEDVGKSVVIVNNGTTQDPEYAFGYATLHYVPTTVDGKLTGNLDVNSYKLTNLLDGTANTDAINKGQLDSAIASLGTIFKLKGIKDTTSELPIASAQTVGDVWIIRAESCEYVGVDNGEEAGESRYTWEKLGPAIDLSGYFKIEDIVQVTGQNTTKVMSQKAVTDSLTALDTAKISKPASPTNGQVLRYNSTSGNWEAQDMPNVGVMSVSSGAGETAVLVDNTDATNPKVSLALSQTQGNALSKETDGLYVNVPEQVQANWNETTTTSKAYIQNKPDLSDVLRTSNISVNGPQDNDDKLPTDAQIISFTDNKVIYISDTAPTREAIVFWFDTTANALKRKVQTSSEPVTYSWVYMGGVNQIKGSAEQTYRVGDVTISSADIGAIANPSTKSNGQFLVYNSTSGLWEATSTIKDVRIPDYDSTTAQQGYVLTVDSNLNLVPSPSVPSGMVLDTTNSKIVQQGADVTDSTKTVLGLPDKADLVNGKVPQEQLPSVLSSVVEGYYYGGAFYEDAAHTTIITPAIHTLYVDIPTAKLYRWDSTRYVEVSNTLELGETSSTAYRGDRGKLAYEHSQITSGNPHNTTAAMIGAVGSVNGVLPDPQTGAVQIDKVPYADNLYSSDNQEDRGKFVFRTAGGNASIFTGDATFSYALGDILVTEYVTPDVHHKQSITIAKPRTFRSIALNQFNKNDSTMVFADTSFNGAGGLISSPGDTLVVIHAVGGCEAGNGNLGYSASWLIAKNTPIANVQSACSKVGFCLTKPVEGMASGIEEITSTTNDNNGICPEGHYIWSNDNLDSDGNEMGTRLRVNFGPTNGYLVLVVKDVDHLIVHPTWSGYMDGTVATYSEDTISFPLVDINGDNLPTNSYGFPAFTNGAVVYSDMINFNAHTYTQNVGYYPYSAANLATVQAMGVDYIYDSNHILYALTSPVVKSFATSISATYHVDDFGTEEFLYQVGTTTVPMLGDFLYGQSLKDKLRVDVLTMTPQDLTSLQQTQSRTNIDALGSPDINVRVAGLNSEGKIDPSLLKNYALSVNNEFADSHGNITITEVPMANNLVSPDNDTDIGSYIYRTSGGEASLSDGQAELSVVSGNSVNPTYVPESFAVTCTDVTEGTVLTCTFDKPTWRASTVVGKVSGNYVFTYHTDTGWSVTCAIAGLSNYNIVPATHGMNISGTPGDLDVIRVSYVRENDLVGTSLSSRHVGASVTDATVLAAAITSAGFTDVVQDSIKLTSVFNVDDTVTWTATQNHQRVYSSAFTYNIGDIVVYDDKVYRCTTTITVPEPWTSAHWTLVSNTVVITVQNITLANWSITLDNQTTNLLEDDVININANIQEIAGVSTTVFNLTAEAHTQITFNGDPSSASSNIDLNKWFAYDPASPVLNTIGTITLTYSATQGEWWFVAPNMQSQYLSQQTLETTYGITYGYAGSYAVPCDGDRITLQASVVTSNSYTFEDYVGPNTFTASVTDPTTWRSQITSSSTYRFTYNTNLTSWTLLNVITEQVISSNVQLGDYGVTLSGDAGRKDYIQIVYVKEVLGQYLHVNPTHFKSVGTNQFNWRNKLQGYKIEGNAIVSDANSYIAWIHACYANAQGWTVYSKDGGLVTIRWSENAINPQSPTSAILEEGTIRTDLGGTTWDTSGVYNADEDKLLNFYFEEEDAPGYIVVSMTVNPATSNTQGSLCVHPRWSGYKNLVEGYNEDTNYDGHTTTLEMPKYGYSEDLGRYEALPTNSYGMPKVEAYSDDIQFDRDRYVKVVERVENNAQNYATYVESGLYTVMYDDYYIYYVRPNYLIYRLQDYIKSGVNYYSDSTLQTLVGQTSTPYDISSRTSTYASFVITGTTYYVALSDAYILNSSYIVADFGTEEYLGLTYPVTSTSLYGQNLRDKLRTDVLTISKQMLTEGQLTQVVSNLTDTLVTSQITSIIDNVLGDLTSTQKSTIIEDVFEDLTHSQQQTTKSYIGFEQINYTLYGNKWVRTNDITDKTVYHGVGTTTITSGAVNVLNINRFLETFNDIVNPAEDYNVGTYVFTFHRAEAHVTSANATIDDTIFIPAVGASNFGTHTFSGTKSGSLWTWTYRGNPVYLTDFGLTYTGTSTTTDTITVVFNTSYYTCVVDTIPIENTTFDSFSVNGDVENKVLGGVTITGSPLDTNLVTIVVSDIGAKWTAWEKSFYNATDTSFMQFVYNDSSNVTLTGRVFEDTNATTTLAIGQDRAVYEACAMANISVYAQGDGKLAFKGFGDVSSVNIPCTLVIE